MENSTHTDKTQTIVIQQPRESLFGRFGKLLLVALGIAVLACISMAGANSRYFGTSDGPQEKYHSLSKTASDKIAIINVTGTIIEGNDYVKQQLDRVRDDESVKAVVLRINSPGGTVTYSDFLYHHLTDLAADRELPIVVSMGSLCASGGYYIAMAAGDTKDVLFAEPTTWTGSIGVIIPHYDLSGLMTEWKVADDSIMSHPLKDMGSPTKPMDEKDRELLQALVDQTFARFKEIVKAGRPAFAENEADLDAVATGQVFTADQALELKLIDKIGFVEDAIDRAVTLAGVTPETVRCVEFEPRPNPFAAIFGSAQPRQSAVPIDALIELNAPRAYYLYGFLPAMLRANH